MSRVVATLLAAHLALHAHASGAQSPPSSSKEDLVGIWASETVFGPMVRGELTLDRDVTGWRATIGSIQIAVPNRADSIRFALPGNLGSYRGALTADRRTIRGWWIQPSGVTNSQAIATPTHLQRLRSGTWRGTVAPLEDRFDLYLVLERSRSGAYVASFRNPQFNSRGNSPFFRAVHVGDSLIITAKPEETRPEIRLAARYDPTHRQISIVWPHLDRTLVLTPRDSAEAVGHFPRVPPGRRWHYHQPSKESDGWTTARASDMGLEEAPLERMVQRLADTTMTINRSPFVHSILIARGGRLVLEEYFMGYGRDTPHDTRSAAKTYASVMIGTAMHAGAPIGPDIPIYPLLGPLGHDAASDSRRERITIAHLLTHTSGLACDDGDGDSPGNEETMQQQRTQPDWWRYTLELPMVFEPGTHYAYCSATMNLVGAALTRVTGTWLPEFFDRTIARPLQFGRYHYNLQPTLEGYLGGGIHIQPRDLLKIGQVYLDDGTWRGRRIVTADWVRQSVASQVRDDSIGVDDGYSWHRNTLKTGDRTYQEYEATGNGGQLVMVVPELELVVGFTAGNYMHGLVWSSFRNELLANVIIPAIRDR